MSINIITNRIDSCQQKVNNLNKNVNNIEIDYLNTELVILQTKLLSGLKYSQIQTEDYIISTNKITSLMEICFTFTPLEKATFNLVNLRLKQCNKEVKQQFFVTQSNDENEMIADINFAFVNKMQSNLKFFKDKFQCEETQLKRLASKCNKIEENSKIADEILTYLSETNSEKVHPMIPYFETKILKWGKIIENLENQQANEKIERAHQKINDHIKNLVMFKEKEGLNQETENALHIQLNNLYNFSKISDFERRLEELEKVAGLDKFESALLNMKTLENDMKNFLNEKEKFKIIIDSKMIDLKDMEFSWRMLLLANAKTDKMKLPELIFMDQMAYAFVNEMDEFIEKNKKCIEEDEFHKVSFKNSLHHSQKIRHQLADQIGPNLTPEDFLAAHQQLLSALKKTDTQEIVNLILNPPRLYISSPLSNKTSSLEAILSVHLARICNNEKSPTLEEVQSTLRRVQVEVLIALLKMAINTEDHPFASQVLRALKNCKLDSQAASKGIENITYLLHEKVYHKQLHAFNQGQSSINPNDWNFHNNFGGIAFDGSRVNSTEEEFSIPVWNEKDEIPNDVPVFNEHIDHSDYTAIQKSVSKKVKLEALEEVIVALKNAWGFNT